jgi:hypothetical protein
MVISCDDLLLLLLLLLLLVAATAVERRFKTVHSTRVRLDDAHG